MKLQIKLLSNSLILHKFLIIRVVLGTILFLITNSCTEYHYIPDDMKFKYTEGDSIIFKSDDNKYDTFEITYLGNGFDVHDKQYYYEREIIFEKYLGADTTKHKFFIDNEFILEINGFLITWGDFLGGNKATLHDSILINNRVFYNVDEIEKDSAQWSDRSIYKVYFSRNYGVLKYWYRDQKAFEFYKDIVH